ncbi:MAG TPA: putative ABC transporter permease [Candidatus Onthousia faecipullorum]|uniref:ABC transporter permease n=1 Tax=Candidatus Onthousia faecipullorum TaxID=2840887 RepID=A0A9D1GB67_9FIRM|nr:putative ABC transporter permease [Candidatus Onthousia faecipullorum]
MLDTVCYVFLLFIIYSFVGYILEIANCSIQSKKLVLNRGFFLGPYLPIYGVSCLLMGSFIIRYKDDLLTVFVMSAFVCTTVEYITSYVLEKIFKARWWDYSDKKFNIEGRVCLFNAFLFGIGGVFFTYVLNPFVLTIVGKLPILVLRIVSLTLIVVFLVDVIITITTLYQVKVSTIKFKKRDVTQELTKIIREELAKKRDIKTNFFVRHMLNAFPWINLSDYDNPLSKLKRYSIKGIKKKQK